MPTKPYIRVRDIRGLKRFLLRLLSERYRDEVGSEKARDLTIISKTLLELFKETDIEERLTVLEQELERRKTKGGYIG